MGDKEDVDAWIYTLDCGAIILCSCPVQVYFHSVQLKIWSEQKIQLHSPNTPQATGYKLNSHLFVFLIMFYVDSTVLVKRYDLLRNNDSCLLIAHISTFTWCFSIHDIQVKCENHQQFFKFTLFRSEQSHHRSNTCLSIIKTYPKTHFLLEIFDLSVNLFLDTP